MKMLVENYWTRAERDDYDHLEALKMHGKLGLDTKFPDRY
jgi:hypothetical protein